MLGFDTYMHVHIYPWGRIKPCCVMFQSSMAVYFDHHCHAPYPGQNTELQWHKTHQVLAVASYSETSGASLTLYQEEVHTLTHSTFITNKVDIVIAIIISTSKVLQLLLYRCFMHALIIGCTFSKCN